MKEFVEKLIERLEKHVAYNEKMFEMFPNMGEVEKTIYNTQKNSYEETIRIVNKLAEEYNNGWIPVEKTLPKNSGYYTVTEEQYSLDMKKKMGVRVSHEVQFDAEEQRWHRAKFLKVIAWKEHETPYQPKGE